MFQKNASKSNREERTASTADRAEQSSRKEKPPKDKIRTNVILSDVEINGTVRFKNDVVIDGRIEGEIFSDGCVTIGEMATVNAEIRSASVVVKGCVNGNIHASDRLELMENAEVTGDISAAVLSMQAGAVLLGNSSVGAMPSKNPPSPEKNEIKPAERNKSREQRELAHA